MSGEDSGSGSPPPQELDGAPAPTSANAKKQKIKDTASRMAKACYTGDLSTIEQLLQEGFDPNSRVLLQIEDINPTNSRRVPARPIHFATYAGHLAAVRLLLEKGASPTPKGWLAKSENLEKNKVTRDSTALHLACERGYYEIAQLLVEHKAPLRARDKDEMEAIDTAVFYGHENIVRLLIQHKCRFTAKTLKIAILKRRRAIISILVDNGCRNMNAVAEAVQVQDLTLVDYFMRNDFPINIRVDNYIEGLDAFDLTSCTPVLVAAYLGRVDLVKSLIERGGSPKALTQNGDSAISLLSNAAGYYNSQVFMQLHRLGIPFSFADDVDSTLHYAVKEKDIGMVGYVLGAGVDPNLRGKDGVTALGYCMDVPLMRYLLLAGSSADVRDKKKRIPLHGAGLTPEIASILLAHTSDLNVIDESGASPLAAAADRGDNVLITTLLKAGASIQLEVLFRWMKHLALRKETPAFMPILREMVFKLGRITTTDVRLGLQCYQHNDPEVMEFLMDVGVLNANGRDMSRYAGYADYYAGPSNNTGTPMLHRMLDNPQFVCLLLYHGADPNARDSYNRLPAKLAESLPNTRTLLQRWGGTIQGELGPSVDFVNWSDKHHQMFPGPFRVWVRAVLLMRIEVGRKPAKSKLWSELPYELICYIFAFLAGHYRIPTAGVPKQVPPMAGAGRQQQF